MLKGNHKKPKSGERGATCSTELVKATVAQLLSAEAQLLQVCTFEALRTLVALPVRGAVGVRDGQAVPRHLPEQFKERKRNMYSPAYRHRFRLKPKGKRRGVGSPTVVRLAAAHILPLLPLLLCPFCTFATGVCCSPQFIFSSSCSVSLMKINAFKLAAQTFIQIKGYRIRAHNLLHYHKGHSEAQ